MDDDLEEWLEWFDSLKNADGTIDVSHLESLVNSIGIGNQKLAFEKFKSLPQTMTNTVSYDLTNLVVNSDLVKEHV